MTDPTPQPSLFERIRSRLAPNELPSDDRGRMRMVVDSLILHLHPTKVAVPTMNWTYSWGLGGLSALLMVRTPSMSTPLTCLEMLMLCPLPILGQWTVNTGSSNGTLRLDVGTGGSIVDAALNPLAGGITVGAPTILCATA